MKLSAAGKAPAHHALHLFGQHGSLPGGILRA